MNNNLATDHGDTLVIPKKQPPIGVPSAVYRGIIVIDNTPGYRENYAYYISRESCGLSPEEYRNLDMSMACRNLSRNLPIYGSDINHFFNVIVKVEEGISRLIEDRVVGKINGFISDIDKFDPFYFNISEYFCSFYNF